MAGAWLGRRLARPERRRAAAIGGFLLGATADLALLHQWWGGLGAELILWTSAISFTVAALPGAALRLPKIR